MYGEAGSGELRGRSSPQKRKANLASGLRRGTIEGDTRLAIAGDYLYVSSVEGAVTAGVRAADRLLDRFRAEGSMV